MSSGTPRRRPPHGLRLGDDYFIGSAEELAAEFIYELCIFLLLYASLAEVDKLVVELSPTDDYKGFFKQALIRAFISTLQKEPTSVFFLFFCIFFLFLLFFFFSSS